MTWPVFTPNYIRQTEAQAALGTITATRWNELWNLNITQGDHSEATLNTLISTTLPALEEELTACVTALETELASTGGAAKIGVAAITGVSGTTVQGMLSGLKDITDTCYKTADAEAALALKEDISDADLLVKSVTFDSANGKFTFTHQSGSTTVVDTALEKVATNWEYDSENQALVLTLVDGSTQSVSLSDFIAENEFLDSSTIDFSVSGHSVTATVKPGSITDSMLSSEVQAILLSYASTSGSAATAAAASEANALTYKNAAEAAATNAATSESNALSYKNSAEASKTTAETKAVAASSSATAAASSAAAASDSAAAAAASAAEAAATVQGSTAVTATLTVAGWSSKSQTVAVEGVGANSNLVVCPAATSQTDYTDAEIKCTAQASGTLTFTCESVPTNAVTVNILIVT